MKFPFWRGRRNEGPYDAQGQIGNLIVAKKVTRRTWRSLWIEQFVSDLLFGLKALRKNPSFTVVAVFTLALAIGANTAIFSIIRAVVIRPLPFPAANRLVQIKSFDKKRSETSNWITYRDFVDLREQNRSFESVGASRFAFLTLTGTGLPEALYGSAVSYDLLTTLGVHPLLGRAFSADDDQPGHEHVVILSYKVWRNEFNGDKEIVGKKVHLTFRDLEDYEVIGVMPPDFNFPLVIPTSINPPTRQMGFWIPLALDVAKQTRFGAQVMHTARLRAGVSLPQAQADIDRINEQPGARVSAIEYRQRCEDHFF